MRNYVAQYASYTRRRKDHKKEFGDIGLDKIKPPEVPEPLVIYFELQRWPGSLLWDGGLMDQPAWVWELVDLAGMVYMDCQMDNDDALRNMTDGKQSLV